MAAAGLRRRRRSRRSQQQGARRQRLPDLDRRRCGPTRCKKVRAALQSEVRRRRTTSPATRSGRRSARRSRNSAMIAIIASLLVISAYIALRFEWKYAVPVLIALMHDLLITAGVYSLIGREVTTSTVAALLTILGFSLYDTIIVFDRDPRERAAHAARRVLADRQPLDERGADPVAGDVVLHAAAGARAAVLRRRDAAGLRLRAASSASRPARTRRSSSPRRCSRTGRSASPSTAAAARDHRRELGDVPAYATDASAARPSTWRRPDAAPRRRRRLTAPERSRAQVSARGVRRDGRATSTRRAGDARAGGATPAAAPRGGEDAARRSRARAAERRRRGRRAAGGPRDAGRAERKDRPKRPRNRRHGRTR